MKRAISIILFAVGLMNLYPIIGVLSADSLNNLYGVAILDNDLLILMRHRAVMLGIIGGFMMVAAFRQNLQLPAIIAGLVSMVAFVGLTLGAEDFGDSVNKVMLADVFGSLALIAAIFLRWLNGVQTSRNKYE
jgi:predicted tellurium resistance membrane protein TerC